MGSIEEKQRHEMNKRSIEKLREKINNMALDRIKKGIPLTDAKILAEVRKLEVMMIEPK